MGAADIIGGRTVPTGTAGGCLVITCPGTTVPAAAASAATSGLAYHWHADRRWHGDLCRWPRVGHPALALPSCGRDHLRRETVAGLRCDYG